MKPEIDAWVRSLEKVAPIAQNPDRTLPVLIDSLADRFGDAPALLSPNQNLTYRELAVRSRRYTAWALEQGVSAGDIVCLLMPNSPEYVAIWIGISRIGAIVSLLNRHLAGDSLAHAINVVKPKDVIVGAELFDTYNAVAPKLSTEIRTWVHGENDPGFARIDQEIEAYSQADLLGLSYKPATIEDCALYIYTSGTTGLPKAANVSHFRLMLWSHWFAGMMDTRPDDRIYNCLPMYHSVGGVVAIGSALVNGGSVAVREGFSASRFWDDVVESKCTIFQYIGELCRYLVNTPPNPRETQHQLRLACGNGLSGAVWEKFQARFHIPQILEFYAATEGNVSLFNTEGQVGSVGRIPSFMPQRLMIALIRIDDVTNEPIRNSEGFCVRCCNNEVGEAIGQIQSHGITRFEGYTDKEANEKKILRNVFASGDAWFRTGDLMRKDDQGFFYFVDRAGDTFRWKGENVSTTEIAGTAASFPGVIDAMVYGVTIPGTEGRAGMITVVVGPDFDLAAFRQFLVERVPEYALPIFLRISSEIETTGTFKLKKQNLARESYDPSATTDPIYFNDPLLEKFVRVDSKVFERISSGEIRM